MNYSQPDFYHFNEDSLILSQFALEETSRVSIKNVFDICCGCGVIGLEVAKQKKEIERVDFLELQKEFIPFLEENISKANQGMQSDIVISDFQSFRSTKNYDLILANPPYFKKNSGRVSPETLKQNCRTFMKGDIHLFCEYLTYYKTKSNYIFFTHPIGLDQQVENIKEEKKIHPDVCIYSVTI